MVLGKYAQRMRESTNIVVLDPDVAEAFLMRRWLIRLYVVYLNLPKPVCIRDIMKHSFFREPPPNFPCR